MKVFKLASQFEQLLKSSMVAPLENDIEKVISDYGLIGLLSRISDHYKQIAADIENNEEKTEYDMDEMEDNKEKAQLIDALIEKLPIETESGEIYIDDRVETNMPEIEIHPEERISRINAPYDPLAGVHLKQQ